MPRIELYTTTYCGYCVLAKNFLAAKGLEFVEIDVSGDHDARIELAKKSGGRKTVPQIFFDDVPIGGYTDLVALDKSGELSKLLE